MIFGRQHPYLSFYIGANIAGAKFPFDYFFRKDEGRNEEMKKTSFGLLYDDRRENPTGLYNGWDRVEDRAVDNRGRIGFWETITHDLTNLVIEWVRKWGATAVKFLCALFFYFVTVPQLLGLIAGIYWLVAWAIA